MTQGTLGIPTDHMVLQLFSVF